MTNDQNQSRPHRPIRSFVRRTGRLTPPQQRALKELWPAYGIDPGSAAIDLDAVFRRTAPRVLEIGFGNGETLVQQAADNPACDYLGIEVHEPGVGHCLLSAQSAAVANLKLIAHDAIEVLDAQVPLGSLQRINLYFPDPWPKKRHHKRRIIQPAFLKLCADRLAEGGALHVATDWANYAEHIDEVGASKNFEGRSRRENRGHGPLLQKERPMAAINYMLVGPVA
jgi:tRNA (guanine-N7-)-methyltransferase